MSVTALHLYEQLTEAQDDKTRARVIAEAFGQLEEHYPHLKDLATQSHLRETELRLQKEIKEVEARLKVQIAEIVVKIAEVEVKIAEVEVRLTRAIHRQTLWIIGSVGTIIAGIRLLEWILAHLTF